MDNTSGSRLALLATFGQDIRYGVRNLMKSPGFTAVAVFTLALGIGANTAIFSVVNTVLLRPLPFKDADQLVLVWQTNPGIMDIAPTSFPNYTDWKNRNRVFQDIAAWASYNEMKFSLTSAEQPEQLQYALVSHNLFSLLGVDPIAGRPFLPEDDKPAGQPVVMLSNHFWQRHFNSASTVIGQSIILDGTSYTVIGVLPASFKFVSYPKDADVWIPLARDPAQYKKYVRSILYLGAIARLAPGATPESAAAEMGTISRELAQEFPGDNAGWNTKVIPLQKQVVGEIQPALRMLLGAVFFVLLIACANVANLLLARATGRQKEMAIRAALGASRLRLMRQLLTESMLLSLIGGVVGLLLALGGIRLLTFIPYHNASLFVPYNVSPDQIGIDLQMLGYTLLLTFATGIIFGVAPALQASKHDQYETLKEGGTKSGAGTRHRRLRSLLVVAEVAMSLVLLICAGLLIKAFVQLQKVDPGFRTDNILTFELNLPTFKYPNKQSAATFYTQVLDRLETLPGVQSAGAVTALPLSTADERTDFYIKGQPPPPVGQAPLLHQRIISANYFQTMGVKIIKGREFIKQDLPTTFPVVVINETMARRFWPNEDPIGKELALSTEVYKTGKFDLASGWRQVVGVVADIRHFGLASQAGPEAYIPFTQSPVREMTAVLRTSSDPKDLVGAVRQEVLALDKDQPIGNVRAMSQLLSDSLARPRFSFLLLTIFAAVALALAAVGVYGVTSYSVAQRTHEFGIRIALGARTSDIIKSVLKEGLIIGVIGIAIGLAGAVFCTRYLSSLLFGVSATDPLTYVGISLLLVIITQLACYFPARRVVRVDPVIALRQNK